MESFDPVELSSNDAGSLSFVMSRCWQMKATEMTIHQQFFLFALHDPVNDVDCLAVHQTSHGILLASNIHPKNSNVEPKKGS
jgi:hypothetical protein